MIKITVALDGMVIREIAVAELVRMAGSGGVPDYTIAGREIGNPATGRGPFEYEGRLKNVPDNRSIWALVRDVAAMLAAEADKP